jgi:SanA protein
MLLTLFIALCVLGLLILLIPTLWMAGYARGRIYLTADVPVERVAIVFGAGVNAKGQPTPALADRVKTAVNLYFAGKVEKLLMSGDNRFVDYNEPEAMRQLALSLGVPSDAIVRDYAGRRTYDTCYRAKAIFGVTEAILVTQAFHMPRALFLCNHLGVKAVGVVADTQTFSKHTLAYWNLRELLARSAAMWDLYIGHPLPVLGNYEPIFP